MESHNEIGLCRRNSPMCTLSQNGYGEKSELFFHISLDYLACLLSTDAGKVKCAQTAHQIKQCSQKDAN